MKISRLSLSEFKRFREPLVLDGLDAGLNIVVGANEAGKSTIATALRAAFLERFKTTKVAEFAPDGSVQARPTVEVTFTAGDVPYHLTKTFLHRPRCELRVGDKRLEGEQAEEALAALLGFEFPRKGQSRPEHAGIPGLLWITQGSSHEVIEPAGHAGAHLRDALTRLSGELAAGDGDKLFDRAQHERSLLLDARLGKPKGAYREAEDALAQALASQHTLQAQRVAWEADVDRLAVLRQAHEADLRSPAWTDLEQRAGQSRARLAALAQEAQDVERAEQVARQAHDAATLWADHVARDEADMAALRQVEARRSRAETAMAAQDGLVNQAQKAFDTAREAADTAQRVLAMADARHVRAGLDTRLSTVQAALQETTQRVDKASAQAADVAQRRQSAAPVRVTERDLKALRQGALRVAALRARADAAATQFHYDLAPGVSIQVGEHAVEATGSRLLLSPTRVSLGALGALTITPGGDDLALAAGQLEALEREQAAMCGRLGVTDLEQAEQAAAATERAARDLEFAEAALRLLAPNGMETLHDDVVRLTRERDALAAQLQHTSDPDTLAEGTTLTETPTVADAQAAYETARQTASALRDQWRDACAARDTAHAEKRMLDEQHAARSGGLTAEENQTARRARLDSLTNARQAADRLAASARQSRDALQAQQPALIEQDAVRLERSARVARDEHHARLGLIRQLQGRLEQAGAQGLGDTLATNEAEVERLTRRRDEFALRAQALTLLVEKLAAHRDATTRRLFAPLAARLNHYLTLVFPSSHLHIGDDLTPVVLARDRFQHAVDSLSFGTQEQLGVLTRLAYADVLREAGRPTLLVLDDALVHSDDQRREQMKRALYNAASRHQILMLTCHGDAWRDMGVEHKKL